MNGGWALATTKRRPLGTACLILLAILAGGSDLPDDFAALILILAALPVVWRGGVVWPDLKPSLKWITGAILAVIFLQLVPGLGGSGDLFITVDFGRTLEAMVVVVVAIGIFCAVTGDARNNRELIFAVLLVGAVTAAFAAIALGGGGLFANRNHLACLLAISIPIAFYVLSRLKLAPFAWALAVLVLQWRLGSDAGVVLSVIVTALSAVMISGRKAWPVVGLALALLASAAAMRADAIRHEMTGAVNRTTLARDALHVISATWPFGSGYGTYGLVYPRFEDPGRVFEEPVLHAHNDWLELVADGGLPALLLIVAYLGLLAARTRTTLGSPARTAALLGLLVILAHSAVDFPLRTPAMLFVFAALNGIVFAPSLRRAGEPAPADLPRHFPAP